MAGVLDLTYLMLLTINSKNFTLKPSGIELTPRDPQWIGAWWLGYFAAGILLIFSSVIVLGFPIEMPGARAMREKAMKDGDIPRQDDRIKGNAPVIGFPGHTWGKMGTLWGL